MRMLGSLTRIRVTPLPTAYLVGTTAIAGSPADAPVQRLVQLFTHSNAHNQVFPTNTAVAWQWSDAAGNWRFDNLDPAQRYGVIAYDHTGTYDPVVKLNLIPTP